MAKRNDSTPPESTPEPEVPSLSETSPVVGEIPIPEPTAEETPQEPAGDAEPSKPKRRGRKPKKMAQEGNTAPAGPSPEEIANVSMMFEVTLGVAFDAVATKRGEHWRLAPDEKKSLGAAWGTAIAPFIAKYADKAPVALAVIATIGAGYSRYQLDQLQSVPQAQTTLVTVH